MVDYIDTSVFVGALVEEDYSCRKYLQTVGYKSKDKGSFSHFVLSEIMKKLLTMPHVLSGLEHAARLQFFEAFDVRISSMLESDKLIFLEGLRINCDLIDELLLVDRRLTYDDALHLASALQANCSRFVTTDRLFDKMEGSGELLDFMRRKNLNVKFINIS